MDTAIPLGIIVNELISNSLKHAFPDGAKGEIFITLGRVDSFNPNAGISGMDQCINEKRLPFKLIGADNGKGIPEGIDLKNIESLGLQLVDILIDQIDRCIELKKCRRTEFTILFGIWESKCRIKFWDFLFNEIYCVGFEKDLHQLGRR